MDEKFKTIVADDNTDGDYKQFKYANTQYIFYDDLTPAEKDFVQSQGMNFDLIGRICFNDDLVRKEKFNEMME